jgi:hypothetical protein
MELRELLTLCKQMFQYGDDGRTGSMCRHVLFEGDLVGNPWIVYTHLDIAGGERFVRAVFDESNALGGTYVSPVEDITDLDTLARVLGLRK